MIRQFIIRLLRVCLLLLIVVVIAIGAVLVKPIWLSDLIEKELANYGISADITTLTADFSDTHYRLDGTINAQSTQYGFDIDKASVAITADWWQLLQGKAFITDVKLEQANITLDRPQLMQAIKQQKRLNNQSKQLIADKSNSNSYRYLLPNVLPSNWQLTDSTIQAEGQTLLVNAYGQSIDFASINIKDKTNGILFLHYLRQQHLLSVAGKNIDLKTLTGQSAKLQQLQATINTDSWLSSRAEGNLNYQGMDSHIQLIGQDNQLLIQATSGGQNVSITAEPIYNNLGNNQDDNQGVKLHFNQVDLAIFKTIQPLLPTTDELPILQGFLDGTLTAYRDKGIVSANLYVDDIGVSHSKGEINHISGHIDYQNGVVSYQTKLNQSHISAPTIFPRKLLNISGSIDGQFNIEKKLLSLQKVKLRSDTVENIVANGVIDFDSQTMSMTATADNVNIAKRRLLIPKQLSKGASEWLGNALVSGKKNHTAFRMRGKFKEIFTDSPASEFLVKTKLYNTDFHYLDNNPNLFIQRGTLVINKKKLTVDIAKGKLKTIPIIGGAVINDLTKTVVKVDVGFKPQPLSTILPIAEKSIAKEAIVAVKKILSVKGKLGMKLHLNLPIWHDRLENQFTIQLAGKSVGLTLNDYPSFPVTDADADILINEKGLRKLTLQGKQGKSPIKLNIKRDKADNYLAKIRSDASASLLLKKLDFITPIQQKLLSRYHLIGGKSPYQADLVIDNNGDFKQVKVQSNLVGTSIKLFDLINKAPETSLPMTLLYTTKHQQLNINLQKRMDLTLSVNRKGQLAGLLVDNYKTKNTYKKGNIQVYWHSNRLDFDKFNNFRLAWQDVSAKSKNSRGKLPAYRYRFDIDVSAMRVGNSRKTYPLTIKGDLANLLVVSPFIIGQMNYKKNDLRATFSSVDCGWLFDFFSKTEISPDGKKVAKISLAKALPQMQVDIEKLIYKGNNIGKASVLTSIQNGYYSIDQLFIKGDLYFLEASGYEVQEPQGITTHLQASFKGEKIKQLVALLKLTPVLDGKFIDISANLSWPGQAHTLNLKQSYGRLKLNAQNVKLTQVNSGIGGVVGLMDIAGILNRISMDFKNLSSTKVSFDTVRGHWNIGGGRAMTRDAYAAGSLIDIKWKGAADIHRHAFDNIKITVIPKASNVIPVIGAATGGVIGAAIGVVVQQVAGDTMNKAVGLPYRLSGKWMDPILTSGNKVPEKKPKKNADKPVIILESID